MALICFAVVPRECFTTTPGYAKGAAVSAGSVTNFVIVAGLVSGAASPTTVARIFVPVFLSN